MKKSDLENFANEIFECKIKIHKMTKDGKWYDKEYTADFTEMELNQKYGVVIDTDFNSIDFDFKTGKSEDGILKTFASQFISKYMTKRPELVDGQLVYPKAADVKRKLSNKNRVSKYQFYTTLYGIGYLCLFDSAQAMAESHKVVSEYLTSKGVSFTNEFSEARWVYRFVIGKDVETHNTLLSELEL